MAHIHMAGPTANGGIVVWLRPAAPPGAATEELQVRHDGVFAEGSFTSANFVGATAIPLLSRAWPCSA